MSGLTKLVGHKVLDYPTHLILNAMTPTPPKRRLGDIADQTALEGGARLIIWGRVRPIGGNIIQLQTPQRAWVKQKTGGGKGGSKKKTQKVEYVYRTYAIGICEGPVSGVIRAWRNNKLVYDARGNEWGLKNNHAFLEHYKFYLGSYSQNPDPTLQSIWGVANVPAYRGTCYMVAINEDVTELAGAVPQWLFEVEKAEALDIEDALYPISEQERITTSATLNDGLLKTYPKWHESITTGLTINEGALRDILRDVTPENETITTALTITESTLKDTLRKQSTTPEALTVGAELLFVGVIDTLISPEPLNENISTSATLEGGSLQ